MNYDDWEDAQDEKERLIARIENIIGDCDICNVDDVDTVFAGMDDVSETLRTMRDELARIEDDFPNKYPEWKE